VLATAAEALRVAALLTAPWLTRAAPALWASLGDEAAIGPLAEQRLPEALAWGGLPVGARLTKVPSLFPRLDPDTAGGPAQ
jgi:methionyl-tRNA synthetase